MLYDSLCHGNPGLEEGSNTLEPFALDFGLVCMGFLYDCRCRLRDSNSAEVGAIYANFSFVHPRTDNSDHVSGGKPGIPPNHSIKHWTENC